MDIIYLIRKDLLVSIRYLWLIVPLFILHTISHAPFIRESVLLIPAFSLFLALGSTLFDIKYPLDHFFGSLPVRRAAIVQARYLTSGIGFLAGTGFGFGFARLCGPWFRFPESSAYVPLPLEIIFLIFLAGCFLLALWLPFYFHSGIGKGAMVFSLALTGVITLITVIYYLATLVFPAGGLSGPAELMKSFAAWILQALSWPDGQTGSGLFLTAATIVTAGFVWWSLVLSIRFYQRRDL